MNIVVVIVALFMVALGVVLGITIHKRKLQSTFEEAQKDSEAVLAEAHLEKDRLIQEAHAEAKNEQRQRRQAFEAEAKKRRSEISNLESKLKKREQTIEKKFTDLERKETQLENKTEEVETEAKKYRDLIAEYEQTLKESNATLERISQMSQEEAKQQLMAVIEKDAREAARENIRQIEEEAKKEARVRAQSAVSLAVQRLSSEYVNDSTVTVVGLPNDEMKGRIIGREGRNIRAIEQATGVDLIIDDTPEAVILSCFNPIRREIAKITLQRLIADGRIHPARIDETVEKVSDEFEQINLENGEQAAFDTGITDLHPELLRALGKLKYRSTGQQSVLQHSVEVAHICGIMAGEMGVKQKTAKRCGLLHDIGKSVDQDTEGHHSEIGAQLCGKFGETNDILEAIRAHHSDDLQQANPLTVILHAANILSSNRPGARKELLETYVKRLDDMETIVRGFDGIDNAYVIQAGREIRAMVRPVGVTDERVIGLSSDIAHKLRKELSFPGQVKVTVLRESKHTDFAR